MTIVRTVERLTGEQLFECVMERFDAYGIPRVDVATVRFSEHEASFTVEGTRGSVVIYNVWGDGVVDAWFGKADSDSGGLARQSHARQGREQMKRLLMLHKRFVQSGRRKILRRASRG